jgi:hypothetical protein
LILRPLPIAARSAVAPNAPMPGIVMSRRATSSRGAIASISRVTSQVVHSIRRRVVLRLGVYACLARYNRIYMRSWAR